jgi:hypothetical protein
MHTISREIILKGWVNPKEFINNRTNPGGLFGYVQRLGAAGFRYKTCLSH